MKNARLEEIGEVPKTGVGRRRFMDILAASVAAWGLEPLRSDLRAQKPGRRLSLTDVDGLLVGHHTLAERPTGCTVITSVTPFTAGVDVRGGAPGTRETDLLRAENTVDKVNAIVLAGGSAFGLDAASGAVKFLEEEGRGFDTGVGKVPIVSSAILFDLRLGDARVRPDGRAGYAAAKAASGGAVPEGNVGAGAGATVGKLLGPDRAMKSGLGSWSWERADGLKVGALVAVNCVGDVYDRKRGRIIAGARKRDGSGFADAMDQLRRGYHPGEPLHENTVIAVVATNAGLDKSQCTRVAQMAQDALGRCIFPSHTPWDGDTVFAVATGRWRGAGKPGDTGLIGAMAADVLETAILRGVLEASSWGPYPSAKDFPR